MRKHKELIKGDDLDDEDAEINLMTCVITITMTHTRLREVLGELKNATTTLII